MIALVFLLSIEKKKTSIMGCCQSKPCSRTDWLDLNNVYLRRALRYLQSEKDTDGPYSPHQWSGFKSVIDCDNLLMILAYFEYDNARIMTTTRSNLVCFFDYLALYGSLEAIEIAAWYMAPHTCYCALPTPQTLQLLRYYGNGTKKRIDPSFRSYDADRARNPLDIFNIWQHVAWKSRQLLLNHLPSVICDLILLYGIQSAAHPKYHHGHFFFPRVFLFKI